MNAYPPARWLDLSFRFAFVDPDAASSANVIVSSENIASQLTQLLDGVESVSAKFTALEHNRWTLGSQVKPLPADFSTLETGWVSAVMSGADGVFSEIPFLECSFSENQTSVGFTLYFDQHEYDYPSEIIVTTYDELDNVINTITVQNNKSKAVISLPTLNYKRVLFQFTRTPLPYRRVRVCELLFGIIEIFDKSSIAEASLLYELDPIAESLPSTRMVIKIDNSDRRFNIINPDGIYAYLQPTQNFTVTMGVGADKDSLDYCGMGTFYYSASSAENSGMTAEFTAFDWFYWMEQRNYANTTTGTCALSVLVADILEDAGISCEVIYDDGVEDYLVTPYSSGKTHRETLRLAVQAARCTAFFNRDGQLFITSLAESIPSDTLTADNLYDWPKVISGGGINTVQLTVKNEYTGIETVYTASSAETEEKQQIKSFSNPLIASANGQAVADWLLSLCADRLTYMTEERGNPGTCLADTVKIYDYFNVNRNAIIIRQSFTFNGGLKAESKAVTIS